MKNENYIFSVNYVNPKLIVSCSPDLVNVFQILTNSNLVSSENFD